MSNDSAQDTAYSDRINEIVNILNQQAESAPVTDVADSAIYAAARYLVFAHSTQFENRREFDDTKEEALEHFLSAIREVLEENLEEYSENFSQ